MVPLSAFYLLIALSALVSAQQYAGDPIPNSLPTLTDGILTYFKVTTPSGYATLTNYFSHPNGEYLDTSKVQRAVVVLHGSNRDPWDYFGWIRSSLLNASVLNDEVTTSTAAIIAPYFPNEDDANYGYPYSNASGSYTSALVWKDAYWAQGANSIYPTSQSSGISTFTAVDQILTYLSNATLYPALKQIVVAGHSMGAQMVHRYATVGASPTQLGLRVPVAYWLGNPDSFAWLNTDRPEQGEEANCSSYDDWEWGLSAYEQEGEYGAVQTYNAAFVAQGAAAVHGVYEGKRIGYARGLNDNGDYYEGCAPYSQGANRGQRFLNWMTAFSPPSQCTVDYYPDIGHDDEAMFADTPGCTRLFLDNWNGDGSIQADFGPRQVKGDNPHPVST